MRKILIVLIAAAWLSGTADAASYRYLFNAGISYPVAPKNFNDYWKIGFNLGVGFERKISDGWYGQVYFDYNTFAIDDSKYTKSKGYFESGLSVEGGAASILVVSANLKRMMARARSGEAPYLIGGIGIYRFSIATGSFAAADTTVEIPNSSQNTVGMNVGVGVDVRIGFRTSFYLEGRYFVGFTSSDFTHHVPLRVGIIFR